MSRPSEDAANHQHLLELINSPEHKELECRDMLKYAEELLVRETVIEFVNSHSEWRLHSGDSDYVVSGRVSDETGLSTVKAYVWELKAPQCYLFRQESGNRLSPTVDLFKAENQLLNYYHEMKGNESFRHSFGVTHSDNVQFGGIIIGSRERWVAGAFDSENKKSELYERALSIRKQYFYDPLGIRIMTWDQVADYMRPVR